MGVDADGRGTEKQDHGGASVRQANSGGRRPGQMEEVPLMPAHVVKAKGASERPQCVLAGPCQRVAGSELVYIVHIASGMKDIVR